MNCGAHSKSANLQGVSRSRRRDSNPGPFITRSQRLAICPGQIRTSAPRTDFRSDPDDLCGSANHG